MAGCPILGDGAIDVAVSSAVEMRGPTPNIHQGIFSERDFQ
jgi:hypothetical protein